MTQTGVATQRMESLDGLRGVAALAVVLIHASEIFRLSWVPKQAFAAVDFFFLLSGYIIAQVYDRRMPSLGVGPFALRRAIRLMPLVHVGVAMGAVVLAIGVLAKADHSLWQVVVDAVCAAFLFPSLDLSTADLRVFSLDPPLWSLSFEVLANLLYAAAFVALRSRRLLFGLIVVSGLGLAASSLTLNKGAFGPEYFPLATFRVLTSFFLGVAMSRSEWLSARQGRLPSVVVGLVAAALAGLLMNRAPENGLLYLSMVFLAFPALMALTLCARPLTGVSAKFAAWAGAVSYPLYIVHHPICRALSHIPVIQGAPEGVRAVAMLGTISLIVAGSWALYVVYDVPVRDWLQKRLLSPKG